MHIIKYNNIITPLLNAYHSVDYHTSKGHEKKNHDAELHHKNTLSWPIHYKFSPNKYLPRVCIEKLVKL